MDINWNQRFAKRTNQMKRTAVREILKVTVRPEIISFAGGLPAAELFPVARVKEAAAAMLDRVGGRSLQYGETEGVAELRDWILGRQPFKAERENLLITSGGQQALDLIGRVLLDQGDVVVVENPTYLALLSAWRPLGVQFVPVPSDSAGMQVEALEALLKRCHPKVIYLVPNFQNPQGTTLARERRDKLVALAREHQIVIVEDDPYGELRYSGSSLPSLQELDAANGTSSGFDSFVIHVGTFSKILMPGLRIGWVIGAREVIDKLVQAKQAADLHTSSLSQYVALELVSTGFLKEFLPVLRKTYGERRDVMLAALDRCFPPDTTWTRPDGGMFLLVTLAKHMNAGDILPKAIEQKVAFVPGEEFHLNGDGKNTMRLNFSNSKPDRIETGIKRLAEVLARFQ